MVVIADLPFWVVTALFIASAIAVWLAGTRLSRYADGIAREFGMTVAVESAEGEGAVFRVGMVGSRENQSAGETS